MNLISINYYLLIKRTSLAIEISVSKYVLSFGISSDACGFFIMVLFITYEKDLFYFW